MKPSAYLLLPALSVALMFGSNTALAGPNETGQIIDLTGEFQPEELTDLRLRGIRYRMVTKRPVSYQDLQTLADSGDGLAAYNLAKRIEALGRPDLAGDATHYYTLAVLKGLDFALYRLIDLVKDPSTELSPARLNAVETALLAHAKQGQETATKALMQFYSEGWPFGMKPEEAEAALLNLAKLGNADIAFDLAKQLMLSAGTDAQQQEQIITYLEVASASKKLGTRTMAENLLRVFKSRLETTIAEVNP